MAIFIQQSSRFAASTSAEEHRKRRQRDYETFRYDPTTSSRNPQWVNEVNKDPFRFRNEESDNIRKKTDGVPLASAAVESERLRKAVEGKLQRDFENGSEDRLMLKIGAGALLLYLTLRCFIDQSPVH